MSLFDIETNPNENFGGIFPDFGFITNVALTKGG
jgi:hypothetical protein